MHLYRGKGKRETYKYITNASTQLAWHLYRVRYNWMPYASTQLALQLHNPKKGLSTQLALHYSMWRSYNSHQ